MFVFFYTVHHIREHNSRRRYCIHRVIHGICNNEDFLLIAGELLLARILNLKQQQAALLHKMIGIADNGIIFISSLMGNEGNNFYAKHTIILYIFMGNISSAEKGQVMVMRNIKSFHL